MSQAISQLSPMSPMALELNLPWQDDEVQTQKLKRLTQRIVLAVFLFLVVMQFLPVLDMGDIEKPVVVKTKVLLESKEEKRVVEQDKPKPVPLVKPKPKKQKVATTTKAVRTKKTPKKKTSVVTTQGLDQISTQLSSLASSFDATRLRKKNVSADKKGRAAYSSVELLGKDQVTQRSAGIVVSDEIMRADVVAMSSHTTSDVDGLNLDAIPGTSESYGSLRAGQRDMENIRRTFESAKGRIFSAYQRALSANPNLEGKYVFKLIINPDGSVTNLSLVSSELGEKDLEADILAQIAKINFGSAEVGATRIKYKFEFFPS